MYNERLKKFIEQIKQKNIETNQEDVQETNGEGILGRVREKDALNNKQNSKTKYIYEDKSRRSANARCYITEKNETERVISGEAVNYYNCKEKKYRQIDNTLEYKSDKSCDRDFAGYENRYNSFKARFAEKSADSDLMRVEKDGYELYIELFKQNLTIRNNAIINRRYNNVSAILQEARGKINPLVSGIRYNELYDGVDFEYEVRPTQIKENITIKTKRENHSFAFKIYSKGLTIREKPSGKEIEIVAEETHENTKAGDVVFTMPSAYMYDQRQTRSDNVYYQLQEITRGEYILQIIPDEKWLSSEERVFPVVIDPNLVVNGNEDNVIYKIVKNDLEYFSGSEFYNEQSGYKQLGFLKGTLSSLTKKILGETELYIGLKNMEEGLKDSISKAELVIPVAGVYKAEESDKINFFEVYGLEERDWMDKELTWENRPKKSERCIAFVKPIANEGPSDDENREEKEANEEYGYTLKIDITSAFKAKYSGIVVAASSKGVETYSGKQGNSAYIPGESIKEQIRLYINYTEKEQIYGSKSIQQPCNQAGTGAIDLFTGDITFVHEDINLTGAQLPINIAHVYNSRYHDEEADETYKCGAGWRLNILQTLKEDFDAESEDPDFKSYIYIDASGIKHNLTTRYYKNLKSDDDTREFKIYSSYKEGGSDWDGTEISDGTYILTIASSQNILTDAAGNKLKFNVSDGRLTELENPDGLAMKIEYNENSIVVSDFNGRQIILEYLENKLQKIISGTQRVRSYEYNLENCLQSIKCYLEKSIFEYDANGYLYKVIDPSKYTIEYKIEGNDDHLCTGYRIKAESSESGTEENAEEKILDEITIKYNSEFHIEGRRFLGFYFSHRMENMTMVENKEGEKEFYNFLPDGSLATAFDSKTNQEISYIGTKTTGLDGDGRWNCIETTQIKASILCTTRPEEVVIYSRGSINNIGEHLDNYHCATCENLAEGCYVFTVIIAGNVASGEPFESLTDEVVENTSYTVLKAVLHLKGGGTEVQFVRANAVYNELMTTQLICLPFFVDDTVVSVDVSVEVRNNPEPLYVDYWDVASAVQGERIISKDKDYALITSYNGKYSIESRVDLSKRTNLTKYTTTLRKGAKTAVTAISTYQSKTSERIVMQDDGISLVHSYTYDEYGNIQKEEMRDRSNAALKMKREYSYTNSSSDMNHNALFSETDENGNRIKYDYESGTGLLKRATLPGTNQNIDYAYSGVEGNLKKITAEVNDSNYVEETSNDLFYNLGYLTGVSHDSCAYYFTYDEFGRMTKVSVGGITFIETVYTDNGKDIDDVTGATGKVVTSYNRIGLAVNRMCGSALCGQAIATPVEKGEASLYNEVFATYYKNDVYSEQVKIRHTFDHALDQPLGAESDYITVTDSIDSITYVMGTKKYIYNYDSYTGELQDYSEFEDEKLNIKFENKSNDENEAKDVFGRSKGVKFTLDNGEILEYNYTYKSDYEDIINKITLPSGKQSSIQTDAFGRLISRAVNTSVPLTDTYIYKANGSYTTPWVEKETLTCGDSTEEYRYTYDANNNVTQIRNIAGELLVSYEYDGLNRLIRENVKGEKTTVYKYNKGGNIQFKKVFDYDEAEGSTVSELLNSVSGKTITYGYNIAANGDLLLSYNGSGFLPHDNCGFPVMWFKHGEVSSSLKYLLQWGRLRLTGITDIQTGELYYYTYNDQGIRTEKKVKGETHKYYLHGEQIIAEKIGNKYIKYYYDGTGICGFNYDGTDYYYQKNIFGDILKIYDGNGKVYGEYGYTAWGKCRIKTNINGIGEINPFRYRGYYYDEEISLYYLNARYYDPEVGRFISADSMEYLSPESINGLNLYAYCGNNPVMNMDPSGHFIISLIVGLSVSFAIGFTASTISQGIQYGWQNINWGQSVVDGLFSVASTALAATGIGAVASVLIGAAMGFGQYAIDSAFHGESLTWGGALLAIGLGAFAGWIGGAGASNGKVLADGMSGRAAAGMKAVITTVNRYGMNSAAYKNVMNLYGKAISASVQNTVNRVFTKSVLKIWGSTIGMPIAQYWGGRLFGLMGI